MIKTPQICTRCVMDTSAEEIVFDEKGVCNFCHEYDNITQFVWKRGEEGKSLLKSTIDKIKKEGQGKEYDCIIGLSGGVDSSYVAYLAKKVFNICPLVVHVDTGWNSELAVKNIENIVKKLDIDLYTHVIDWEEMQDLQLSFFKSGIVCQDNPQDHAFVAVLRKIAREKNIKYFITGANVATECILPKSWDYNNVDSKLIKSIHKMFGTVKLKTFPLINFWDYYLFYPLFHRVIRIDILNMMEYSKSEAMDVLQKELDWKYYGGKHHESIFTKFFQTYYQPIRFGFEKRRAHLASLVVTGELTRSQALEELTKAAYTENEIKEEKTYIAKKLGISEIEFEQYMNAPCTTAKDFPNNSVLFTKAKIIREKIRKII
jgi:N-acetyl sugar amidotransferase